MLFLVYNQNPQLKERGRPGRPFLSTFTDTNTVNLSCSVFSLVFDPQFWQIHPVTFFPKSRSTIN